MKMRTYSEEKEEDTNCKIPAGQENNGNNREAQNEKGQGMKAKNEAANVRSQNNKARKRFPAKRRKDRNPRKKKSTNKEGRPHLTTNPQTREQR